MANLAQPHDRLFKALMSHPETAGALLREYLPPAIVALLAPGDPELASETFVSQERIKSLCVACRRTGSVGLSAASHLGAICGIWNFQLAGIVAELAKGGAEVFSDDLMVVAAPDRRSFTPAGRSFC